ncbi:hypothetical protein L596_028939 [Steinernema carpocapsae]|uniref:MD-2-related lipid-recognition domain-containing protein n=1 Tax=Steinernema carpocapsae TaxID=34508 RepID=A0A4U5LZT8_STECR|nr:hypothetical protein L596_028939 [Steinernema carpocapsae]
MKPLLGALLLFFAPSAFGWWFGTLQKITVNGTLSCDKNYVAIIKLRDHDLFDPDDTLAEIPIKSESSFSISGEENEVSSINPYIRIIHSCQGSLAEGRCFTIDFEVPQDNIGGTYKLALVKLSDGGQSTDCAELVEWFGLKNDKDLFKNAVSPSATAQVRLSKENVGNATGSPRVVPSDVVSGRKLN